MVLSEAASVVSTLKGAADIVERFRSDNREDLRAAASQLAEMLITARMAALQLIEEKALLLDERAALNNRIQALEGELGRHVDFGEHSQKYERVQTRTGQFVYREKHPPGSYAGAPNFCPKCFLEKKASILQGREDDSFHYCPACKWNAYL